jgi:hypothetical protein
LGADVVRLVLEGEEKLVRVARVAQVAPDAEDGIGGEDVLVRRHAHIATAGAIQAGSCVALVMLGGGVSSRDRDAQVLFGRLGTTPGGGATGATTLRSVNSAPARLANVTPHHVTTATICILSRRVEGCGAPVPNISEHVARQMSAASTVMDELSSSKVTGKDLK